MKYPKLKRHLLLLALSTVIVFGIVYLPRFSSVGGLMYKDPFTRNSTESIIGFVFLPTGKVFDWIENSTFLTHFLDKNYILFYFLDNSYIFVLYFTLLLDILWIYFWLLIFTAFINILHKRLISKILVKSKH